VTVAEFRDDPEAFAADVAERVNDRDPAAVFALVSGGHDSAAMLLEAVEKGIDVDAVAHANTGVGIESPRTVSNRRAVAVASTHGRIQSASITAAT